MWHNQWMCHNITYCKRNIFELVQDIGLVTIKHYLQLSITLYKEDSCVRERAELCLNDTKNRQLQLLTESHMLFFIEQNIKRGNQLITSNLRTFLWWDFRRLFLHVCAQPGVVKRVIRSGEEGETWIFLIEKIVHPRNSHPTGGIKHSHFWASLWHTQFWSHPPPSPVNDNSVKVIKLTSNLKDRHKVLE